MILDHYQLRSLKQKRRISGLYYITPTKNIDSILMRGILPKNSIDFEYESFANEDVQRIRHNKKVPGWDKTIHETVNTYINPLNPTLYRVYKNYPVAIIKISLEVLIRINFQITKGNAASENSTFYNSYEGFDELDWGVLHTSGWDNFPDGKNQRNSEVLFDNVIIPEYIEKLYFNTFDDLTINPFSFGRMNIEWEVKPYFQFSGLQVKDLFNL